MQLTSIQEISQDHISYVCDGGMGVYIGRKIDDTADNVFYFMKLLHNKHTYLTTIADTLITQIIGLYVIYKTTGYYLKLLKTRR